jgi:hypothetical protein
MPMSREEIIRYLNGRFFWGEYAIGITDLVRQGIMLPKNSVEDEFLAG